MIQWLDPVSGDLRRVCVIYILFYIEVVCVACHAFSAQTRTYAIMGGLVGLCSVFLGSELALLSLMSRGVNVPHSLKPDQAPWNGSERGEEEYTDTKVPMIVRDDKKHREKPARSGLHLGKLND